MIVVWTLAGFAVAFAVADWVAVWSERRAVRFVTKPATLVALIGVAITLDPFDATVRWWMVVGLVLSLVGDVALLLEDRWFVVGLGAFLSGHVAYIVSLQLGATSGALMLAGLVVVLAAGWSIGRTIVGEVRAGPGRRLTGPVVAYMTVISSMVVSAFGTAAVPAIGGALLFYASDATLAWNRFVESLRLGPVAVMVTYHLAQAGLVTWLVTG
jgi:uncharacterized membrane protein YhhN